MNIALLTAAGTGTRMGQDIPKQFMTIDDCPVIVYTMLPFQRHPQIDAIAVVCLSGWETVLKTYANQYGITKLKYVFPGGKSNQDSIHNGLTGLKDAGFTDDDIVLIHDGVRPLVSANIISKNIKIYHKMSYAITGLKCKDVVEIASVTVLCSTSSCNGFPPLRLIFAAGGRIYLAVPLRKEHRCHFGPASVADGGLCSVRQGRGRPAPRRPVSP